MRRRNLAALVGATSVITGLTGFIVGRYTPPQQTSTQATNSQYDLEIPDPDFTAYIKFIDPKLEQAASFNDRANEIIRSNLSDAMGDLYLPSPYLEAARQLHVDYLRTKLKLLYGDKLSPQDFSKPLSKRQDG